MAKLFPTRQTFVDEKIDGEQIVITRVTIVNATSDHVEIPTATDAGLLHLARTTADPTFYLTGRNTVFNIDGGTIGDRHVVVSRHTGMLNFDRGDQAEDLPE